ncbi:hypothetical protein LTR56_013960 [Elasticomyces elasticus]|nr:hypothetical protein LTR56_013960 [Elasticomyces elasticus]KAK3656706.1 hypothetical protein LTR22_009685 [Elasticomyces elasticus]KAK4921578.1 hypothetical protein LTR49_011048 [Elasticomyces elasticus]KAK5760266.1 hypothetical protein LTS12_009650 [Elasticomyces elasticus]
MNNQAPTLRRAQAYRDLRLAKDIGSMSYILTYRQAHIVHIGDTIGVSPDAIDLVPMPLFHRQSSQHYGGEANATAGSIFDYHEQDIASENGLEPFPDYDDAYASGMLEPSYATEAIDSPQYVEYDDKYLIIEATEGDAATEANNGGKDLSTEKSVEESDSTVRVQQEMLATLQGFPYDMRAPRTSRQPRSCTRVVKAWIRRLIRR